MTALELQAWLTSTGFQPSLIVTGSPIETWKFRQADIHRMIATMKKKIVAKPGDTFRWDAAVDRGPYKVSQLAEAWGYSEDSLRRIFKKEPDALKLGAPKPTKHKHTYLSIRIPHDVAVRVHRRLGIA